MSDNLNGETGMFFSLTFSDLIFFACEGATIFLQKNEINDSSFDIVTV